MRSRSKSEAPSKGIKAGARKANQARQGQETRKRILSASRALFNRYGVEGVPMLRISAELGISPGHLAYHYKGKAEICRELAVDLERDLRDVLFALKIPFSPKQVVTHVTKIFRTLWQSRFFFISPGHLVQLNEELAALHDQIHNELRAILTSYLSEVVRRGGLQEPKIAHGIPLLSDNIIAVWLHWVTFQHLRTPAAATAGREALRSAMAHHLSVLAPHISPSFVQALYEEADRQLGPFLPPPLRVELVSIDLESTVEG